jgi:alkanesulfonate monooxygenase SsuD/methylene tetrahydromethanopterin reductase-like flavin-dependent oxidoreductase (luciferase family)
MSTPLAFGLQIPHAIGAPRPSDGLTAGDWFGLLEVDGVDSLWTLDQVSGRKPSLEPIAALAYAAALTTRVRLGVAVLIGASRGPLVAAKSLSTLDSLSGGRLDVGLGLGATWHYPAFSVDRVAGGGAGAVLDEFVEMLRALWSSERVTIDGRTWQLDDVGISPRPVQQPHPPLWFGGGEASIRRAVDVGVGWLGAGRHSNREFLELAASARQHAEQAGRRVGDGFDVAKRVYIHVTSDAAAGATVIHEWFDEFYGRPELGPSVTVTGDVDSCAADLTQLADGGATLLILHPLVEDPGQYQLLTGEVIPAVRRSRSAAG